MAQLKSRTQTPAPSTTAAPAAETSPSQPPLPQPGSLDILAPLHALLSRLEPSLNTYTPDPDQAPAAPSTTGSSSASALSNDVVGGASSTQQQQQQQLSYKDAAVAAGFLKTRIRKILAELGGLADMSRTVEQQEAEIGALEGKIARQRETLVRLGVAAEELARRL